MQKLLLVDNESKVNFKCKKKYKNWTSQIIPITSYSKESSERSRLLEEGINIKRKFKTEFLDYPNVEVCLSWCKWILIKIG